MTKAKTRIRFDLRIEHINKAERMESLKIRLIPQFKKTLKGNTVTK